MIVSKQEIHHEELKIEANALIIDIETTGFSPKFASIYLIGMVYKEDHHYICEQWLCEKDSDEYELLFKLNQVLDHTPTLYHYNGDQFDMPFIKKRMALYNMTCHNYQSKDLLKVFRPYKKALGLENLKLKTIEAYFGYDRQDQFSGGDLIPVYKDYLDTHNKSLEKDLILHNFEDLTGLMDVLDHLVLIHKLDAFKSLDLPVTLTYSTIENGTYVGKLPIDLEKTYSLAHPFFNATIAGRVLTLQVPVTITTLYFHFPNPKDYYYLVNEDYAIHKSIGQFVAKDHRVQATKKNAYIKKEGFFLPALKKYDLPIHMYYENSSQTQGYVSVEDLVESDTFNLYIQALLSQL